MTTPIRGFAISDHLARLYLRAGRVVTALRHAAAPQWRAQRDLFVLETLDNKALSDIGVSHESIGRFTREAHWFYDERR